MKKPRNAWSDEPDSFCPHLTVYEAVPEPVDTGLVDASGIKIVRRPRPAQIGFVLKVRS